MHKKGVADLAVHPFGRVGLTVGRDAGLVMVNLVRGRRSFCCRLDKEAGLVRYRVRGWTRRRRRRRQLKRPPSAFSVFMYASSSFYFSFPGRFVQCFSIVKALTEHILFLFS